MRDNDRVLLRVVLATLIITTVGLAAQENAERPSGPEGPTVPTPLPPFSASAITNMVIRPVGPGIFELGKVRFNKTQRTVTFPAAVNMRGGSMEYFLVTAYGKTHESILRTEAEPYHIHLAMLLLDAMGAGTNSPPNGPPSGNRPGPIESPGSQPVLGDRIHIEVSWVADGSTVRRTAEELVFNSAEQSMMTKGPWVYNGSWIMDGMFVAQRDGSVISLMTDYSALINNPRRGHENDEIWTTYTNNLPDVNTPVEVTIKLEDQKNIPASKP